MVLPPCSESSATISAETANGALSVILPDQAAAGAIERFPPLTRLCAKGVRRLQVLVRDNNVDQALRVLKKKMQREGVFREMKRRRFFEKPSERATREKAEAIRRASKQYGRD